MQVESNAFQEVAFQPEVEIDLHPFAALKERLAARTAGLPS
ncbi:MAG: hypothetical protein ACYCW6_06735 [Candidatus Xenobia bacterium]